jgi:hypothetical protein
VSPRSVPSPTHKLEERPDAKKVKRRSREDFEATTPLLMRGLLTDAANMAIVTPTEVEEAAKKERTSIGRS